jgi:hypothetical protein
MNDFDSDSESGSDSLSGESESVNEDDLLRDALATLSGSRHLAAPFVQTKKAPNSASSSMPGSFSIDKTVAAVAERKEPVAVTAERMESTPTSAMASHKSQDTPLPSHDAVDSSHDECECEGDDETDTENKSDMEQDSVEQKLENAIFQPLERNVRWAKRAVVAALTLCSLMVCVTVYKFAEISDVNTFKDQVSTNASDTIAKAKSALTTISNTYFVSSTKTMWPTYKTWYSGKSSRTLSICSSSVPKSPRSDS